LQHELRNGKEDAGSAPLDSTVMFIDNQQTGWFAVAYGCPTRPSIASQCHLVRLCQATITGGKATIKIEKI